MAVQIMSNARAWVAGYDLSGDINAVALDTSVPIIDTSVIRDTWTSAIGGLKSVSAQLEGFWQAGTGKPDDVIWANMGLANVPVSFAPSAVEGTPAFTFMAALADYALQGATGDVQKFSVSAEG